jgi:hypothetical protein
LTETNDAFWSVAELLSRVEQHDYTQEESGILIIAKELAKAGRIRSVGRPIGEDGTVSDKWEPIPSYEWTDLRFMMGYRGQPHPGEVFRGSGRLVWTAVQFSERDVRREWLDTTRARPRRSPRVDYVMPPRPTQPMDGARPVQAITIVAEKKGSPRPLSDADLRQFIREQVTANDGSRPDIKRTIWPAAREQFKDKHVTRRHVERLANEPEFDKPRRGRRPSKLAHETDPSC